MTHCSLACVEVRKPRQCGRPMPLEQRLQFSAEICQQDLSIRNEIGIGFLLALTIVP